jgi:hypothetical protein
MNDELLAIEIMSKLHELSNYDDIIGKIIKDRQTSDMNNYKVSNIDIIYLLKNDNLKEMLLYLVNKIKSSNELERIRDRIKIYSLYKEKIDKIQSTKIRRTELLSVLNEKSTKLLNLKEKLNKAQRENYLIKSKLEENTQKFDLLKTKEKILEISDQKAKVMIGEFGNIYNNVESFKTNNTSNLMSSDDCFKDFLSKNEEFVELHLAKEKNLEIKTLPLVSIELYEV